MAKAKDRKISEENREFYRLGFLNGEAQLQSQVAKLRAAYGYLFEELTRLDREQPVVGVFLDYKTVNAIIKALKNATKNSRLASKLKKKKKEAQAKDAEAVLKDIKPL